MQPGDSVKVLAPFADQFPDVYVVVAVNGDGSVQVPVPGYDPAVGATFAAEFLEKVS